MLLLAAFTPSCQQRAHSYRCSLPNQNTTSENRRAASYLVVMKLHALSLQPPGAHRAEAEATGQELQPDGGEQGGGLEGTAGSVRAPGLAAFFLHARDQHHDLVERLQPQLEIKTHPSSQEDIPVESPVGLSFLWPKYVPFFRKSTIFVRPQQGFVWRIKQMIFSQLRLNTVGDTHTQKSSCFRAYFILELL